MSSFPDPFEFFTEIPLYQEFNVSKDYVKELGNIFYYNYKIDIYCPSCGKESIYYTNFTENPVEKIIGNDKILLDNTDLLDKAYNYLLRHQYFTVKFYCSRNVEHSIIYVFRLNNDKLLKIGQYPSIADLSNNKIITYRQILEEDLYLEFSNAVKLASSGIGIGSYIYFKKIIENLLEEAHMKAKSKLSWSDKIYKNKKIGEKIILLKNHLPSFVIENNNLYSILDKEINELTENECLKMLPLLKLTIELILDRKIERINRMNKINMTGKMLGKTFK